MFLSELSLDIPVPPVGVGLLEHFEAEVAKRLPDGVIPIRFVVTESTQEGFRAEIGVMSQLADGFGEPESVFRFVRRPSAGALSDFNVALVVPTGIGAEIGGHAGDAGPVVRLLGAICDNVITHPNVVNASDVNEIPENGLYVEGSVLSRLLMGTVGLVPVRANRVLAVIDTHPDELFVNAAVNTINAARATYGLDCTEVVQLDPPMRMSASWADSGRASGRIEGLERLCRVLAERITEYDAIAISSVINVPSEYHYSYFEMAGEMVNPWGGVEALLTHTISSLFDAPSAHSPMFESREVSDFDPGVVDPRMAAEAISLSFFQCVLKGLLRAPRVTTSESEMNKPGVVTASDLAALVIPDGCLGLPTLGALEQGIPVIAVRENRNLMRNELGGLPWGAGGLHRVDNYWEAAGVLAAIKSGVAAGSVRRPLRQSIAGRPCQAEDPVSGPATSSSLSNRDAARPRVVRN